MKIKKIISFLIVAVLFVSVCFSVQPFVNVEAEYMRDITAFDLVSEIKVGVNIGNSLDSVGSSETAWGNPRITKQLIQKYKELGFDTIRLPVTWRNHIDSSGFPDTAWVDRVQEVVDWILAEDLKCIINTHHEQNWLNTNSSGMTMRENKFRNLWTDIANRFKNYDERLMFEAYNEILKKESDWSPADEIDYQNANTLSQLFVDTVRETGGNNSKRVLIINTYGAIREVYGFALPRDTVPNKLVVQFHSYDPQGFCFAGSQSSWSTQNSGIIDSYCRLFYENFVSKGTPVILGEFGAVDKDNEDDRAQYAKIVAQNCVKYGIKPIWWDDGGDFKLISRQSYNVLFPQIVSALVDNSTVGIAPSATTYTIKTTTYKTYSSTSTTPKSTTTTTLPDIKIDAVNNVNLQAFQGQAVITWSTVSNVDFYRVYKSCNGGEFEIVTTVSSNLYNDLQFDNNSVYRYKITACKKYGEHIFESDFSNIVTNETVHSSVVGSSSISTIATEPTSEPNVEQPSVCLHTTVIKNQKVATYFSNGYTGDTECVKCGGLISQGRVVSKLKLLKPDFAIKRVGKKIKVTYKKVNNATGFQVRYKLKGKWKIKTFSTKKTASRMIGKFNKKGRYQVQVRSMIVSGKQKAYSPWSNTKRVKII